MSSPDATPERVHEPERVHDALDKENADRSPFEHSLVLDLMLEPAKWKLWPAVAVLRWMQSQMPPDAPTIVQFRSRPSLSFPGSEIHDLALNGPHFEVVLNTLGIACTGSPLPPSDVARIIEDTRNKGGLAAWLDGLTNQLMHILEAAMVQHSSAFSAAREEPIEAIESICSIVGNDAPLSATLNGSFHPSPHGAPDGALALTGLFAGPPSCAGLASVVSAITGLRCEVEEFAGARLEVARPARVGHRMRAILGAWSETASAGVEVVMHAGEETDTALAWGRDPVRLATLHRVTSGYVGSAGPEVRLILLIDSQRVPPAALDGATRLGACAVTGGGSELLRIPLRIQ